MKQKLIKLFLAAALLLECAVFKAQAVVSIARIDPITLNALRVVFSEPVDAASISAAGSYTLTGGVTVNSATPAGNNAVLLSTSNQTAANAYDLTIANVKDAAGNTTPSMTRPFTAPIIQEDRIFRRSFDARNSADPLLVLNDPRYPNEPTQSSFEPRFEYPPGGGSGRNGWDNEIFAWFVPPTSGDYVFFLATDDNGSLFLSTDDNPANKKRIAQETSWSSSRQWHASAGGSNIPSKRSDQFGGTEWPTGNKITLDAGKRYYIQGLYHEGPPINNFAVYVKGPDDQEPNNGDLPTSADSFDLFVSLDGFPPFNYSEALGSPDFNKASLKFTYDLDPASIAGVTVTIPGLTVSNPRLSGDGRTVIVDTSPQTSGTTYSATISGIKDVLGRTIPVSRSTMKFTGFVVRTGGVIHKFWQDITPNNVDALLADPRFPNDPTFYTIEPRFEYGPNGSNESGATYGNQLTGWVVPPVTGNYVFFLCTDDGGRLYLSIDDKAENKKLIAEETVWSYARQWITSGGNSDLEAKRSDKYSGTEWPTGHTITLTKDQRYYIEVLHTEGAGGDNAGVLWMKPGDAEPENGNPPIDGAFIENFLPPPAVTITQQPIGSNVTPGNTETLSVVATGNGALSYQWQKAPAGSSAFENIPGATSASYTTPVLNITDHGIQYRVLVTAEGFASVASAVAMLSLDAVAPTIAKIKPVSPNIIRVEFSEPVLAASVNNAANYSIDGGITVNSVELQGNKSVVLRTTTQAEDTSYNLTVTNVKDVWNNNAASLAAAYKSLVARPGIVIHRFFDNIADLNPLNLPNDPRYPDNPTFTTLVPNFEYPPSGVAGDNYSNEIFGWFVPSVSGDHIFHLAADNAASLFLSTDEDPANKKRIAVETVWSSTRQWTTSGGNSNLEFRRSDTYSGTQWPTGGKITLDANKRYYMQVLHHEEVGGDYVGVYVQAPGEAEPTNNDPAEPASSFVNFVSLADYPPYTLLSAHGSPAFNQVEVKFGYELSPTAAVAANFSIPGLTITGARLTEDRKGIILNTSAQTPTTLYTVTVGDVKDVLGRALAAGNTTATFYGFVRAKGGVVHRYYYNVTPNAIDSLTQDPRFPNDPSFTTIEPRFEYPRDGVNEAGDNYGNQLYGWLVPPVNGNYVFFLSADNAGQLYLSTDESPANKKLIAEETVWSSARNWTTSGGSSDLSAKRSDEFTATQWPSGNTITLEGGKAYYMEVLHTEEIGGDSVGVAWQKPGDPVPANGSPAIDGSFFENFLPPAPVTITQQPTSVETGQNSSATFSVVGSSTAPLTYQWQKAMPGGDFVDIADATSATFNIPFASLNDNNARYRVRVMGPALTVTSQEAVLTVTPDTSAPTIMSATRLFDAPSTIIVKFLEALGTSANTAANFKINGTAVTSAVLGADLKTVTLTSAAPLSGTDNTLDVSAVLDLAGNQIAANTSLKIGIQESILFVTASALPLTFPGDAAVHQHLVDRGFHVQVTTGVAVPNDGSTANGKSLIIVSSSLGSADVGAKFRNTAIPVLEWEAALQDEFGFQPANGTTTGPDQTQINIKDATSPLAAGFPAGLLTVLNSGQIYSVGAPVGARIAATLAADPNGAILYSYEKGDKGNADFVMPERRAFIFLQDNTATALNANGWKIFDATTDWLLGKGGAPSISIARSGADIILTFTGTLQVADNILGPWSDVNGATSPRTVTPGAEPGARFWRTK